MNKYAQMKRFHHDCRLRVYMYYFVYVNPETMPVEYHFPASKKVVEKYNRISTPGPVPKH